LGHEAKYDRESETADLTYSSSITGRESINSEFDRMLHRDSKLMSLYTDEIVLQFLAARDSLVQHEEPIVEA
jgi:hypothetical protein